MEDRRRNARPPAGQGDRDRGHAKGRPLEAGQPPRRVEPQPNDRFERQRKPRVEADRVERQRQRHAEPQPEERAPRQLQAEGGEDESIAWGRRTVLELLRAEAPINRLYVLTTGEGLPREFFEMARQRNIPVVRSPRERLDFLTHRGNHQGVVAQTAARSFVEWQELLERAAVRPGPLFLLALDGVQDPGNFGALLRTAEGAGVQGVAISAQRSCGLTATVSKASAGADAHLPVARLERLDRALATLAEAGIQVVAAMPNAQLSPYEVDFRKPTVVVLGAEGDGIDPRVARVCTHRVRLPMLGQIESLNVSACGAVLLYEAVRQRTT